MEQLPVQAQARGPLGHPSAIDQKIDPTLNQFLVCFQTLVQSEDSDGKLGEENPTSGQPDQFLLQQQSPSNKAITEVFEHRDQLLQAICQYLNQTRGDGDTNWQAWQTNGNQLKNTIWTLQVIIEDINKTSTPDESAKALKQVQSAIIAQLDHVDDPFALISLLKLVQFVFSQTSQERVRFSELSGFTVLLTAINRTDSTCQELILSFLAKQVKSAVDEGKDLMAKYSDDPSKVKKTFNHFVNQVRQQFFKKISQEYEEKLNLAGTQLVEEEEKLVLPEDSRSRENSGNMLDTNPNGNMLKILQDRKLLETLRVCIESCEVEKLANILKVIQIAQGFSSFGYFIFETAGVQGSILSRFEETEKFGVKLHPSYEVLAKLCKFSRSNRIRVTDSWEFFIKVTHQIVNNGFSSEQTQRLLLKCFDTVKLMIQSHATNAVTLHEQKGLVALKEWLPKVVRSKESPFLQDCLANVLSLTIMVLRRVPDKQSSHEYALIATNLIADQNLSFQLKTQLLLFTAQILRDNIQKLEETPSEGYSRFVNDKMKQVFMNCIRMMLNALGMGSQAGDERLNKLVTAVALLALEVQIKIKQVFFSVRRDLEEVKKCMLVEETDLDFQQIVKQLLSSVVEKEDENVNEFRGASVVTVVKEGDFRSNKLTRLYIASRLIVALQTSEHMPIEAIVSMIQNRDVLAEEFLNPFLAMVLIEQNNSLAYQIQNHIAKDGCQFQTLQSFSERLMKSIIEKDQNEVLHSLLSLTLLISGHLKCKEKVDAILNHQVIVQQIEISAYSYEHQLFILHCLFELILENWMTANNIEVLNTVFDQEFKSPSNRMLCEQFRQFLQHASIVDSLDFVEVAVDPDQRKKSDVIDIPVEVAIFKEQICRMRDSPKCFNFFLLCLSQTHYSVQTPVFEDLTNVARQSLRNKRVMTQSMPHTFLLKMLQNSQADLTQRSPQKFEYNYIQQLVNFIQCLFSYGILMPVQSKEQDDLKLILQCLSQGRRLNSLFVESTIQTLSTTNQSVRKFVNLPHDCNQATRTLKPAEGKQIGVATWLNLELAEAIAIQQTDPGKPKSPQSQTVVLTLTLANNFEVEVVLIQELKKLSLLDDRNQGSIAGESSIRSDSSLSQDVLSLDHDARQDLEIVRHRSTQPYRFGSSVCDEIYSIQVVVYKTNVVKELLVRKAFDLEEMIAMSVVNVQQFNHYCVQLNNNSIALHINGHECLREVEVQSDEIRSVVFPAGASISQIKFFQAPKWVTEIEKMMQENFEEGGHTDLVEVPTWRIQVLLSNEVSPPTTPTILKTNSPVKSPPKQKSKESLTADHQDGSFIVRMLSCSDQIKFVRVKLEEQIVQLRKPSNTLGEGSFVETLIRDANCEVFQETQNLLTLKNSLSSAEVFKAVFHMLEFASTDDECFLLSFRLLASLLIKNQNNALSLFVQLNGFKKLEAILKAKVFEMHNNQMKRVLAQIIEIACNELNCSFRIDPNSNRKKTSIQSPIFDDSSCGTSNHSRLTFLEMILSIIKNCPVDQGCYLLQMMHMLLSEDRNLKIFHKNLNFNSVLDLFRLIQGNYRLLNLYDTALGLFELFIDGIRRELFESTEQDLQLALDFILTLDFDSQQQKQSLMSSFQPRVTIDCLSIIAIHLLSDVSNSLLEKLLNFDLVSVAIILLSKEEIEIREYALKFFQLLLFKSPREFTARFNQAGGFAVLSHFILNPKTLFSEDAHRPSFDGSEENLNLHVIQKVSINLMQILLDSSVCKYDNVNEMSPENQTLVHQVMNQSRIAEQIVAQIKVALKTPKKTTVKFFDLLEPYFSMLQLIENDASRYICIKSLQSLLQEPVQSADGQRLNMDYIHLKPGLLECFVEKIYEYQIAVASQNGFESDQCLKLLGFIASYSGTDELAYNCEDEIIIKYRQEQQTNFSRSVDSALELLTQVMVMDMLKPASESKTLQVLLNFPSQNDLMQYQVVTKILKHFQKNPKVNDQNTLENLYGLINSLPDLIAVESYPQLIFRAINLVNLIAFKSSMEVRRVMKTLKLLEQRDLLIMRQLQSAYKSLRGKRRMEYQDRLLLRAVSSFSYETLASKPVFVENKCTEYLCLILLQANQVAPDCKVTGQMRQDLKQKLSWEVLQFEQNKSNIANLVIKFLANSTLSQQQESFNQLFSNLEQMVAGHVKQGTEMHLAKEAEQKERRRRLIAEKQQREQTNSCHIEALRARMADLQKEMIQRKQSI